MPGRFAETLDSGPQDNWIFCSQLSPDRTTGIVFHSCPPTGPLILFHSCRVRRQDGAVVGWYRRWSPDQRQTVAGVRFHPGTRISLKSEAASEKKMSG